MDDVGALLHAAVDDVPVRPVNPATLRSRARRSRVVLAAGVATALAFATTAVALVPRLTPVAAHPWPSACPIVTPGRWWGMSDVAKPGPKDRIVPRGTRRVLVCRYGPYPQPFRPYAADGSIVLPSSHPRYGEIVGLLNAVPSGPGSLSCIMSNEGARYVLLYERAHGETLAVTVDRGWCSYVLNGTRATRGSHPVVTALDQVFAAG
jgi:hypothetical protein